jgi:hypothetical protein
MTAPHRHLTLLAVLCLASCTSLPTAPEPAEFKLSSDELRQQSKATRSLGIVELYADEIRSSQDEKGETFHLASGNVLLVKKSTPPIHAKAPEILLNSEHAEVRGLSVVKKGDLLYLGQADESKILIDGVQLLPKGPNSLKRLSNEPPKLISKPSEEIKAEPLPEIPAAEVKSAPEVKPETKPETKPAPKPKRKAPSPAPKSKSVSKPADTPKPAAPAVDRAKLLQLMREPEN